MNKMFNYQWTHTNTRAHTQTHTNTHTHKYLLLYCNTNDPCCHSSQIRL